jgi:hypothetical protein
MNNHCFCTYGLPATAAALCCTAAMLCEPAARFVSLSECVGDTRWPLLLLLPPGLRLSFVTAPLS